MIVTHKLLDCNDTIVTHKLLDCNEMIVTHKLLDCNDTIVTHKLLDCLKMARFEIFELQWSGHLEDVETCRR